MPYTLDELREAIRAERLRRGLTQTEAGELVGLAYQLVSHAETGRPGYDWAAARLAGALLGDGTPFERTETVTYINPAGDTQ